MRKLPRDRGRLGSLFLFDKLDRLRDSQLDLEDPTRIEEVVTDIRDWLGGVLADRNVVRGWWAQGLFVAVVVAIGEVRLIQELDNGDLWFSDEPDGIGLPDFLIVTADGRRLVVEVKAVNRKGRRAFKLPKKDLARLRAYAAAIGTEPFVATFWEEWGLWALVPAEVMDEPVTVGDVMKPNEMGLVGDRWLGTRAPLSALITVSSGRRVAIDEDRYEGEFTITDFALHADGVRITEKKEERLAFFLMLYGGWQETEHVEIDNDGRISVIRYEFAPRESDNQHSESFELLGPISSMYSRYYRGATEGRSGTIGKLGLDPDPGMVRNMVPDEYHGEALHVWRLKVQP